MGSQNKVDISYISVACNLVPHALDWGTNNLICFGACNGIAIYNPEFAENAGSIRQIRTEHTGRINCVRWIKDSTLCKENKLISGSSDKTAIIWEINDNLITPVCKLEGHQDAVNVVHAITFESDEGPALLIATASADHTIKLWLMLKGQSNGHCFQTLNLKSEFAFDLKLTYFPKTSVPLLIYGGSDVKVNILAMVNREFVPVLNLLGHEDWIRAIDIIHENESSLLFATSAQDCLIKLWRLKCGETEPLTSTDDVNLKVKSCKIIQSNASECTFDVNLEANLAGHDNWIYGLHWDNSAKNDQSFRLLSASMDKTMIIWEMDQNLGIWIEKVRVGEVGGNTLGFYGCRFSPDGKMILAHGFQGAFHLWEYSDSVQLWQPHSTVSGHFKEVVDFDWDPMGEYIISVSLDQTTRLHCPWAKNRSKISWHEMARPQIHGYDMTSVAIINRHTFVSGADEKLVRVFEAPKNFVDNYYNLTEKRLMLDHENATLPEGASIPSLGLSNKAIYDKTSKCDTEAKHPKDIYQDAYFVSTTLDSPPTEETLLQNSLWPEIHKLYGHGNEIYALAANKLGTLLASACKATKPEHAQIIIWDTKTWKELGRLSAHSLTITQMEFSPCNTRLLSVSRDRTWCIFKLTFTDNGLEVSKEAFSNKKTGVHSRIIWSCSWSPDGDYFATGSRDKKTLIWGSNKDINADSNWTVHASTELEDSVTAVAFSPVVLSSTKYVLAVGLENGNIHLYTVKPAERQFHRCFTLSNLIYHHLTVRRLRFRPLNDLQSDYLQLASCADDHILHVYNLNCDLFNFNEE